jgi:hypothetical protein
MLQLKDRKPKFTQYALGGAVAVVILFAWISIPLMQSSSLDSSVSPSSYFKTRTADVSSLGSEIPPEGAAPGYSLNGGMLNNPVTSGENIASTLFQSGPADEPAPQDPSADSPAGAPATGAPLPGVPGPGYASPSSASGPRAKLASMPSITGGNSNSMTAGGGTHNKFFGGGASKKEEFAPLEKLDKKIPAAEKRGGIAAKLEKMEAKSALAARSFDVAQSRGGASEAFGGSAKGKSPALNTEMEESAEIAGLGMGAAAQDLKRNDPQISRKKVSMPEPKPEVADEDQKMKEMLIQMLLSSLLGGLFSGG